MKQSPLLEEAQTRMAPGAITKEGFMGHDQRSLTEIIDADGAKVARLGLTHEKIAARLEKVTHQAVFAMGAPVCVGPIEVTANEAMGKLPCPFEHPGLYPKAILEGHRCDTSQRLRWTSLQVHLIGEHGFYEGRGSTFRLEPEELARFLGLKE